MRSAWFGGLLACALVGCDDGAGADEPMADIGMTQRLDASTVGPDASGFDLGGLDAVSPDGSLDAGPDAEPDAATGRQCPQPEFAPVPARPLGRAPNSAAGIDAWERAAFDTLADAVLADPGVHFVAAWDATEGLYRVRYGVDGAVLRFSRDGAGQIQIVDGAVDAVFANRGAAAFGNYEELLATFVNPNGAQLENLGYSADDPRVGYLPAEAEAQPFALQRIAALFDAPDAPDLAVGVRPYARGGASTHGGIGVLQSQSTLILSGKGARAGARIDTLARLPDVLPTALAALCAPTVGGIGPDGEYDDGLQLLQQDGRVLWEALDPEERPEHVVLVLFDGLQATEINHIALDDSADGINAPTFKAMARGGAVFTRGAVTNYPSVSAPGHMTVGTGVWAGHHGMVDNGFWGRAEQAVITPWSLLEDPTAAVADPSLVFDLIERATVPGVETVGMAAHRAFGRPDADGEGGAFVAVINEVSLVDADYTTLDFLRPPEEDKASLQRYALADDLAVAQIERYLIRDGRRVPTILQLSMVSTDSAGETKGPNSELLRETVENIDRRMARIVAAYAQRGVLDDTLFVLTSDHGMGLQDPTRNSDPRALAQAAGVKTSFIGSGMVYLRTLEIEVESAEQSTSVRVLNHDNSAPVEGQSVVCAGCAEPAVGTTDAEGRVQLGGAESPQITVEGGGFNPAHWPLEQ